MGLLRWVERMTIPNRVRFGYAVVLVLIIAMLIVGVLELRALDSGFRTHSDKMRVQLAAANQVELKAIDMVADCTSLNVASMVTLVSDQQKGGQQVGYLGEAVAELTPVLDSLTALEATGSEGAAAIESMRSLIAEHERAAKSAYSVALSNIQQALADVQEQVLPVAERLQAEAGAYKESVNAREVAGANDLSQKATTMWIIMLALGACVVGLCIFAALRVASSIKKRLREASTSISGSATQLRAVASQVAASAAQTAASTNETTATVEEVKQTAQMANEKASQVADSSQNVAHVAETGRATVEETMAAFERIQNQMVVVGETVNRLSDQTQAVSDIIGTVNDIAEQSNLLSVNASIEAAKAGDQGKGFTVVAQEVKNLAEQSKQAVSQVRDILGEIQKAGTMAVQASDQGREAIEAGRRQSLESGEAVQTLADAATEAARSAVQISASSRQQLAGMEQISQAIESINQAGVQSAAGTRQVEEEVQRLQELALGLKRLVDARATT
ncbi:MAG: hypothetical protein JXA87_10625 [Thermoleophilia bacterium]|nr:hypothetical protein [Thermoleophilia bacterium]